MSEAEERSGLRSCSEAVARQRFIGEAKTWLGTPFRDQADIKGGGVDCAMLLVRSAADTGLITIPADDPRWPRPYPPQWHLHRDEERFLGIIGTLGREVQREPIPGDVVVYQCGRCYSHGGIIIENDCVIHAYYRIRSVVISALGESDLAYLPNGKPRPFKLFDIWAR